MFECLNEEVGKGSMGAAVCNQMKSAEVTAAASELSVDERERLSG